jgi:hypothetical protein
MTSLRRGQDALDSFAAAVVCLGLSGGEGSVRAWLCFGDKAKTASDSLVPGPGLVTGGSVAGATAVPVVRSPDPTSAQDEPLLPQFSSTGSRFTEINKSSRLVTPGVKYAHPFLTYAVEAEKGSAQARNHVPPGHNSH